MKELITVYGSILSIFIFTLLDNEKLVDANALVNKHDTSKIHVETKKEKRMVYKIVLN